MRILKLGFSYSKRNAFLRCANLFVFLFLETAKRAIHCTAAVTNNARHLLLLAVTAALSLGEYHSIMMKRDGSVWVSGNNLFGQLGYNRGADWERYSFVQVVASGAISIATLGLHSMLVKQDGSVWATGRNADGQLGDGTTLEKKVM